LKLETDFAAKNEAFFQHVLKKGTLRQIVELKLEMVEALRNGFTLLLKVQGLFTALLILCAGRVLDLLGLGAVQAGIFQITLVGTFLLILFLALIMILHYLDKRRDAMIACALFAVVNTAVTSWSIMEGARWFGVGFLMAAAVAMVYASFRVNHHVQNLEFDTFTSQPIYG
jgi:uncharacterized membrane protein